jgi:HEAT repeat protein
LTREPADERAATTNAASAERDLITLQARLRDPQKEVRAEAMQGLVKIGKPAVRSCIQSLQDGDWRIRYRAAEALGLIGDPEAYPALVAALADVRDHVRYMAAKGLGLLGDSRAVGHLLALQDDENEFVRRSTARALGAIGGAEAREGLLAALRREDCEGVRDAIEQSLRNAGEGKRSG